MTKKKTLEQIKKEIYDLVGNEYTLLSDNYVNNKTKILMKHNICGNEYLVRLNDFNSRGRRCPICANKQRGLHSHIENYLTNLLDNSLDGSEYEWLDEYNHNNKEKLKIYHKRCGNSYMVRPNDFQQGYRCPYCSDITNSKGSLIIKKILNDLNIEYECEYKFEDCKGERTLPFDFKFNNIILEYEGSQHFRKPHKSSVFCESFDRTVKNDWIKNNYIINKEDIVFLRIPYNLDEDSIAIIINELVKTNDLSDKIIYKYNLLYKKDNTTHNLEDYYKSINKNYFKLTDDIR